MAEPLTLFLCGDVMTGRGIDQILPHPCNPVLHEPWVRDARRYVQLAEEAYGAVPRPVDYGYIWGDIPAELARREPALRLINLETAVTTSDDWWRGKGINYRMNPANISCIMAGGVDCCSLANNHVLDWGYTGLAETLETLRKAGIRYSGAGENSAEADAPAILETAGGGKVLFFACGTPGSGVPPDWQATEAAAGVNFVGELSLAAAERIGARAAALKRTDDIAILSIHWGGNWGYGIQPEERAFAHRLIDTGIDIVHGHSSHHVKGIEVYRERLILYGCGDFLNDYEGIGGYEHYRGDLGLMYFPTLDSATGRLIGLSMTPTRIRNLRVNRASDREAGWLESVLTREGRRLGTRAALEEDRTLTLIWQ